MLSYCNLLFFNYCLLICQYIPNHPNGKPSVNPDGTPSPPQQQGNAFAPSKPRINPINVSFFNSNKGIKQSTCLDLLINAHSTIKKSTLIQTKGVNCFYN
ncbi:MAG: hypothetical protein CTY16_03615 [Methylobacter sp.]|nr:MAG: hypothetical protein CTY16_03615 [Methylobacter sp.]